MSPGAAAAAQPAGAPLHPARRGPGRAGGRSPGDAERADAPGESPRPPLSKRAALKLQGRRPWSPPARAPRSPSAGVRARGAQPWAGGAGGRSGGRAGSQARGRSRRQVRPRRAGPGAGGGARGFIVYGAGPARIFRPFLHTSAAPEPAPLPGLGTRREGGGLKWKRTAGRGRRVGADVQRPRAARLAGPPSLGSAAAAGAWPGGKAEAPGWIAAARTGASWGRPGAGLVPCLNANLTAKRWTWLQKNKQNMGAAGL